MVYLSEVSVAVDRKARTALSTALSKLTAHFMLPQNIERVIIKPSVFDPKLPGNTTKWMLAALVKLFQNVARIEIVESANPYRAANDAFAACGYSELASERVSLIDLSSEELSRVEMSGHFFKDHMMPSLLVRPGSILVSLATAKTDSGGTTLGASIKNLFGLLPEMDKSVYHQVLDDVLLDLLTSFRPALSVVDLTEVVASGESGASQRIGAVAVSYDPVALDAFCAQMFGLDPLKVGYLSRARQLGLGEALPDRIKVLGTAYQKTLLYSAFERVRRNQKRYIPSQ